MDSEASDDVFVNMNSSNNVALAKTPMAATSTTSSSSGVTPVTGVVSRSLPSVILGLRTSSSSSCGSTSCAARRDRILSSRAESFDSDDGQYRCIDVFGRQDGGCSCFECEMKSASPPVTPTSPAPHSATPVSPTKESRAQNRWKTVKNAIIFVPFMQKWVKNGGEERSYAWVQLAGHKGNFLPGENGTILKKMCSKEHRCLQLLMNDILRPYCAKFYDVVEKGGDKYIRMEDLLGEFDTPTVMDCKMGVRTYLESELAKAKVEPTPRKDMYEKMIKIDANEPTAEEHAQKALLKPRYMQWRESISSTVTEGFRIEGIQIDKTMNKDFKTTKSREQVKATLRGFISDNTEVVAKYVTRLNAIHSTLITSKFFMSHEMIGSSLLFVHDRHGKAGIWLIDFGKTIPLPEGVTITHRSPWVECNHEDGYLTGIENLRDIFKELLAEVNGTNADEAGGEVTSQQTT